MKIKDIISNYRAEHKLTMEEFATRAGLSKGYISMLERGAKAKSGKEIAPSLTALSNIAFAMSMGLNDLLDILDDVPVTLDESLKAEEQPAAPTVLAPDEIDLLSYYRSLSDADKRGLLNFARFTASQK